LTSFFSNAHPIRISTFNQAEPVPSNVTIAEIEQKLKDVKILMNSEQISRTLEHILP
jgi:hypothetical protein